MSRRRRQRSVPQQLLLPRKPSRSKSTQSRPDIPVEGLVQVDRALAHQEVLAWQQAVGNQVVSRLVQRALAAAEDVAREPGRSGSAFESRLQRTQGNGRPLPAGLRAFMDRRFGRDFRDVRMHTDTEAVQLNRAIGAEAFTHQNHIYFGNHDFNPGSKQGKRLLAHELTHVVQQAGKDTAQRKMTKRVKVQQRLPAGRVSPKRQKLYLDFVRMKRNDAEIGQIIKNKLGLSQHSGGYGHYWTEIGDLTADNTWKPTASYGWWPSKQVNLKETFKGVPGELNQGDTNDPHHGEDASKEFHPVMELDPAKDNYQTVRDQVINQIKSFSTGFSGSWNWRFGWGKNCQTFQKRLKKVVGLHNQKGKGWFKKPSDVEALSVGAEKEEQAKFDQKNPGIDYQLNDDLEVGDSFGSSSGIELESGAKVRLLDNQLGGFLSEGNIPNDWDIVQIYDFANNKHYFVYYDRLKDSSTQI